MAEGLEFSGWWARGRSEEFVGMEAMQGQERVRSTVTKIVTNVRAVR